MSSLWMNSSADRPIESSVRLPKSRSAASLPHDATFHVQQEHRVRQEIEERAERAAIQ
jgi:hypothetical protein